jgi:hypothetical protein
VIFELNTLPHLYKHNLSLGQERFGILSPRLIYTWGTDQCSFVLLPCCKCTILTSYQTWLLSSHLFSHLIIFMTLKHFQIMFSTSPSTSFHVFVCSSPHMTPFLHAVVSLLKLLPTQCCPTLNYIPTFRLTAETLHILQMHSISTYWPFCTMTVLATWTLPFYKIPCRRCSVILLGYLNIFTLTHWDF